MAKKILIIGKTGSGKSTSLEHLDPKETVIIKCQNKELPFKKGDTKFKSMYVDSGLEIVKAVETITTKAPQVKNIIIDDLFYMMARHNMNKVSEVGYKKFTEMATEVFHVVSIPDKITNRDDLTFVFITHSTTDPITMETDVKNIGKMVDSQVNLAGMFTVVLEAQAYTLEGQYKFKTHNTDGSSVVKTPRGMFEDDYIDNDLNIVLKAMKEYY